VIAIFWIALVFGFYMAWSIGANDAANAMGTSVGSKAVSLREAIIIAAIFEFLGAYLAGADVADTMRSGILDPALFNAMPNGAAIFAIGMLSALMAAAIWLHIAAFLGWPVSTTHSIVGAITGFGVVSLGVDNIKWAKLASIVASWGISPLTGGVVAFSIFYIIRRFILEAKDPVSNVKRIGPVLAAPVFFVLFIILFFKGLKNFYVKDLAAFSFFKGSLILSDAQTLSICVLLSLVSCVVLAIFLSRITPPNLDDDPSVKAIRERSHEVVERVFRYMQVLTACFMAFAHGSNDVANSIGPLAAIVSLFQDGAIVAQIDSAVPVPPWVLLLGAAGIVIGLATYGWKVIDTVGTKITEITPSRGFAAEFGAASTILVGSKLGLPLSTTHTIVGAVIGVGFARGINALNLRIILNIIKSWIYTIPFTATLTIILFFSLKALFLGFSS
jgi:PiT family inorganic phosphate transporter